jgi:predicted nucleotide-binding protein (sugar kinase/HSP70/actin superfamily)
VPPGRAGKEGGPALSVLVRPKWHRRFTRRRRAVSFPYLGTSPEVFRELLADLGHEAVVPPRPNRRTLSLGVEHSPEFACLPFKILLGTYLEAIAMGADTIVTSGGVGPCRAGQYSQLHELILRELGHDTDLIVCEPPRADLIDFLGKVAALNANNLPYSQVIRLIKRSWQKLLVLDEVERLSHWVRARELVRGSTTPAYLEALRQVYEARTPEAIDLAKNRAGTLLRTVPTKEGYQPLKIGIVGEIYVLIEPSANLEIEEVLGEMGVETERSIYLTGYTRDSNLLMKTRHTGQTSVKDLAAPYLGEMIGGHGQDTVGHAIMYARSGFDGVVQLAPFTCIPEIVAKSVLERVSTDFSLPFLSVSLDEQTGRAGLMTRMEAFVDLLWRRRARAGGAKA